jgi:hypothetical protein
MNLIIILLNSFFSACALYAYIGGPLFYLSGMAMKAIGINGVLTSAVFFYTVRFFNYALISDPWHALPAEILRGVAYSLFWSASTMYVYQNSPQGLTATMLGLLNGIYGGMGQSVGALIGGYLSRHHGIPQTFLICGMLELCVLALFSVYQVHLAMYTKLKKVQTIRKDKNGAETGKDTSPVVGMRGGYSQRLHEGSNGGSNSAADESDADHMVPRRGLRLRRFRRSMRL